MKNKKLGFTLAEILIALAVIGIAAAMTIPILMQNIGEQQYKSAWKNTYAAVVSAATLIANDNSGTLKDVFTNGSNMQTTFLGKLNYVKSCDNNVEGNCWSSGWKNYVGTAATSLGTTVPGAVLSNGAYVVFGWTTKDCSTVDGLGAFDCGSIYVDVNGSTNPNRAGKDIFRLHVQSGGIIPYGATNGTGVTDGYDCGDSGTAPHGLGCSALYLSAT